MRPDLKRLLPRHFKVLELSLEGYDPKHIAQTLDMSLYGVSLITNSARFQDEISKRRSKDQMETDAKREDTVTRAQEILNESAQLAAETQVSLLNDPSSRIKLSSSKEILDRVFESNKSVEGDSNSPRVVLNTDSIQVLQIAIKESHESKKELAEVESPTSSSEGIKLDL